jgi:Fe-Mn family superoxide dismutase
MTIELPSLAYAYEALEPVISRATLETHHGKHHRGYVDKLNVLVRGTDLAGATLEAIVKHSAECRAPKVAVFNNAAQAWNHAFYWKSLRPAGGHGPRGALAARIAIDFKSDLDLAEAIKSAAAGHFASGWVWLVLDNGVLKVVTTANADTPIVHGQIPLLAIDLWEHAYYLDYRERRAAHVAGVVDHLLDWEFAERNFEQAGDGPDEDACVSGRDLDSSSRRGIAAHAQ